ncbi:PREDICTED: uncharacterized protein LOC100640584 [Amphimedon queenslandica]|uniref:Ig-like domain-containing protein n=1 Tax=Amphimedon queenslandica TaxID=400682 RepID=A0A1X7UIH5_AMPQE|nr:PREDICTED: uncharacterized protein LOC100640584 [Amphimedon queenslandica]|eukprot:XP_003387762.2 PREDICTED: uncharacterized protein LOC100640584 [Amphimedon queenslandica]
MSCRFHSGLAPVGVRSLLMVSLLLINADWFCQAQCPPDVVSVFILNDRTMHVPLTEPLCLQCRFLDNQGNFSTFSDGVWRKGSTVLNDGDFSGNVNLSSTSITMYMSLEYPDDVVNVGDTITCSSSTAGQHIITFGDFVFLNPTVSPNGLINVIEGSNVTLTCSNPGNTGTPRYVWVNDSDSSELTPVINNPPLNLSIIDIDSAASGNYTCRSANIDLQELTRETTVTINVQQLSLPSVYIQNYQNMGSVIINCTYETYDSSIDVKWEHNDSLLDPNSDPYITVITQSTYSELTISSLTQQYTGGYQCIVTNGAGSIKSGKVNVTISPSVSSSTGSISNTLQATSSGSVIQPSSTIQLSSSITVSPSNTQAVSSQNDRTVVYAVSGLIVGGVLIILVVVITATGCYFYRQYRATYKYDVNGEATSFTLEEFNDGPEKLKPYATLDELLTSYNSNDNLINGKGGGSSRSSSIRIKRFDHHEEIDISTSETPNGYEKEPVLYSKVNKPRKKPDVSAVNPLSPPPLSPPALPPVLLSDSGQPINLDPDSQPLVTSSDPSDSEVPPDKVLYADLTIAPSSKPPGSVPSDPDKVVYSDISQLRRTASGHVVYADLNMLSSQVNSSKPTVALNSEKVVYVDIDAIKTQ